MRVTSKGQVTIPQKIRQLAGISPQTEVEFEYIGRQVILRKVEEDDRSPGRRLVERLRGSGTALKGMRTDDVMKLTRSED